MTPLWNVHLVIQKELDMESKKDVTSETILGTIVGYLIGYPEVI